MISLFSKKVNTFLVPEYKLASDLASIGTALSNKVCFSIKFEVA